MAELDYGAILLSPIHQGLSRLDLHGTIVDKPAKETVKTETIT